MAALRSGTVHAELSPAEAHVYRRTWIYLLAAFCAFCVLAVGAAAGIYYYATTATQMHDATLALDKEGAPVLVRYHGETDWRQARPGNRLQEGDVLHTAAGTHAIVTLFDGTTIEVFGETELGLETLRTTRYFASSKTVRVQQTLGSTRWRLPDDPSQRPARMEVRTPDALINFQDAGGTYRVDIEPDGNRLESWVTAKKGAAVVYADGRSVRVIEGQKTRVITGRGIDEPGPAPRELVANGQFRDGLADWQPYHDQGGDEGELNGTAEVVGETLNGERIPAVRFLRKGGATDHEEGGLTQEIGREISSFDHLRLSAEVKLVYQSLSGGGYLGYELPLMIRIKYRDTRGYEQDWVQGYYYQNREHNPARSALEIEQNVWIPVRVDLRQALPNMAYIRYIQIYASGHDYESLIANISLTGE